MAITLAFPCFSLRGFLRIWSQMFSRPEESSEAESYRNYDMLVREYSPLIDRICFGYAKTKADFDDLRQDVLLNLWRSMLLFKGECSLKTWVYRLTLNSCVTALRSSYRRPNTVQLAEIYEVLDDDRERKQMLAELHEAIGELDPIDKAIILLWLEEESYDEIAVIVGLSRSNVAVRIHRAKEKLKLIFNK